MNRVPLLIFGKHKFSVHTLTQPHIFIFYKNIQMHSHTLKMNILSLKHILHFDCQNAKWEEKTLFFSFKIGMLSCGYKYVNL